MTGTCPECWTKRRVDGVKIGHHTVWAPDGVRPCAGIGRRSVEANKAARIKNKAARIAKRAKLVEPFRQHAVYALDAAEEGRTDERIAADTEILLRVALAEYRGRFDNRHAASIVEYRARRGRAGGLVGRGDLYCRFCGVLLALDVGAHVNEHLGEWLYTESTAPHAIWCALKHLAFNLAPAAPGTALLPEGSRVEDPEVG